MDRIKYSETKKPVDFSYMVEGVGYYMDSFHYHNAYELYFLCSGHREYIVDGKYLELEKHDAALISSGVLHRTQSHEPYERYLINFDADCFSDFFTPRAVSELMRCFRVNKISLDEEAFESVLRILSGMEDMHGFAMVFSLAAVLNILNSNLIPCKELPEMGKNNTVSSILDYIHKNYAQIQSISQIADEMYITKYYMCHLFKAEMGISVIKYLNGVKIQAACAMIDETDKKITDIAFECGFNSVMYFCRVFKEIVCMSPVQYRKRNGTYRGESGS